MHNLASGVTPASYLSIAAHYDACLARHGDTARGADWPNEEDRARRFDVMLDVGASSGEPVTLCDLGCGTGEFYRQIRSRGLDKIDYRGIDISHEAIGYARRKFPGVPFLVADVLTVSEGELERLVSCDYLVMNGLFTRKGALGSDEMWRFLRRMVERVWPYARRGLAFNVMSKQVDWERDDLFHLSLDEAAAFLHRIAGRRVRFRANYGLYEYTAFAMKEAPSPLRNAEAHATIYSAPRAEMGELDEAPAPPLAGVPHGHGTTVIPVCAPRLPAAGQLRPYLERIDVARWYSNHGPLATLLQTRLSEHFDLPSHAVNLAASGTAALVAAILGAAGRSDPKRPIALCPSYSFVATASAIQQCGYTPRFVDILPDTLALDPDRLLASERLDDVGLVVVVAPYGRAVNQVSWRSFQERTGIPVVLDAAASFDQLRSGSAPPGLLPTAVSLHATKVFSTGEGGLVLIQDPEVADRCARALNFGFSGSRDSIGPSINGKMSEYHAAVGLAELDGWPAKRRAFLAAARAYRDAAEALGIADRVLCDAEQASCYALFAATSSGEADAVAAALRRAHVEFRLWYGTGIHDQPFYVDFPRSSLQVTAAIAPRFVGLPMAIDLGGPAVSRILSVIHGALEDFQMSARCNHRFRAFEALSIALVPFRKCRPHA